ncbi:unnamed protein product [Phaeothamnion confervicola]
MDPFFPDDDKERLADACASFREGEIIILEAAFVTANCLKSTLSRREMMDRVVAPLMAALFEPDCLGLVFGNAEVKVHPSNAFLVEALQSGEPWRILSAEVTPVLRVADDDAYMAACISTARANLGELIRLWEARDGAAEFYVKWPLSGEHLWFQLQDVQGETAVARLDNVPVRAGSYAKGDSVELNLGLLSDWMVRHDGAVVAGGFYNPLAHS